MKYQEFEKTLKDGQKARILADEHAARLLVESGRATPVGEVAKPEQPPAQPSTQPTEPDQPPTQPTEPDQKKNSKKS